MNFSERKLADIFFAVDEKIKTVKFTASTQSTFISLSNTASQNLDIDFIEVLQARFIVSGSLLMGSKVIKLYVMRKKLSFMGQALKSRR